VSTPNLAIVHIAAAQNQPEVTANDAFDALDDAANLPVSIANSDADQTLTQAQLASGVAITITGALTANRHVNLPASIGRLFLFLNGTTGGHNLIVQVTGAPGATVTVSPTAGLILLYSDGTNVTEVSGTGGGSSPNFADAETPSGSCNGSNTSFSLANSPSPAGSLILVQRTAAGVGSVLFAGGVDYTLSGASITTVNAPASGDSLLAWYRH
jgi:hypothetical protein